MEGSDSINESITELAESANPFRQKEESSTGTRNDTRFFYGADFFPFIVLV
jgi:hypothetical protein